MNRCTPDVNGHSEGSASASSSSRQSRTPRNVLPDREGKSTNITKMVGIRINATNNVNLRYRWHLRFLWLWIFRVQSSESWSFVVGHVGTNGSKEAASSVLRMEDFFLKVEAADLSEMCLHICQTSQCYVQGGCAHMLHRQFFIFWCYIFKWHSVIIK